MKIPKDAAWRKMVGDRLERSLVAVGKKPAEIARLLGISQQRLSNYTKGSRPLDIEIAMQLADRFGITLDWLYMGEMRGLPYELAQRIVPMGENGAELRTDGLSQSANQFARPVHKLRRETVAGW